MAEYGTRMHRGNEVSHEPRPRGQISTYLDAAWYNGLTVAIAGYRNGAQIYNTTTGPLGYTSTLQTFNWVNIDKVSFTSLHTGRVIDNQSTCNPTFVMDNLSIAAVPEPESYALAGLGLVGAVARRCTGKSARAVACDGGCSPRLLGERRLFTNCNALDTSVQSVTSILRRCLFSEYFYVIN